MFSFFRLVNNSMDPMVTYSEYMELLIFFSEYEEIDGYETVDEVQTKEVCALVKIKITISYFD